MSVSVDMITENFTKRPVWLQVDVNELVQNMEKLRNHVGKDVRICAVVKGNAYGHGAVFVAKTFLAHGAQCLAVACLDEGIELRKAGITAPILVLGHTDGRRAKDVLDYDIEVALFHYDDAVEFSHTAGLLGKEGHFHIVVDTGMGRIGYQPTLESIEEVQQIAALPNCKLVGCFTHFCVSDMADKTFTNEQFRRFMWFKEHLEAAQVQIPMYHCCGSAGTVELSPFYCDMVRPGVVQFGYDPSREVTAEPCHLDQVMSLRCCISHVKIIQPGDTVSYGRHFTASRPTKIATLPVGYADGYPRILSNNIDVLVHGMRAPQVGNICMDQCMIDVTDIPDVAVGDEVVLFGKQGDAEIQLVELAEKAGTIVHEILCNMNRRVPRVYVDDEKVVRRVEYLFDDH